MASTRTVRRGQVEIGIIEHEGHEYAAYGATICGREITGYVKFNRGHYWLTTWSGGTTLDCRSEVNERFWNGGLALMFRLPRGRFVVGYASGRRRHVVSGRVDRRLRPKRKPGTIVEWWPRTGWSWTPRMRKRN